MLVAGVGEATAAKAYIKGESSESAEQSVLLKLIVPALKGQ